MPDIYRTMWRFYAGRMIHFLVLLPIYQKRLQGIDPAIAAVLKEHGIQIQVRLWKGDDCEPD